MRFATAIVLALITVALRAQPPKPISWHFALSLSPNTDGQLFSLWLVKVSDTLILETRPLSRGQFIKQIQGRTFSAANPDAEDLFRKYDVKQCTLPPDSAAMGFLTDCTTLDDLWRLRYWEFPLHVQEGQHERTGWSEEKLRPSDRQLMLLGGYGLKHTTGLIYGENMFRLLHDMGDPEWIANYRSGL
jgi:hypothetical protein